MRHGDPLLDRAVRAETKKNGAGRRNLVVATVAIVVVLLALALLVAATSPASAQALASPSPSTPASPSAALMVDQAFPGGLEVSDAIGVEVEAQDIQSDLSQLWEGIEIDADAVVTARMRVYGRSDEATDEMLAMALLDIVQLGDAARALGLGEGVATAITGPSEGFQTELEAELVATSSWASDDGFGGSTIVAVKGPFVVVVVVAAADAAEMAGASEAVTSIVLDRLGSDE